MTLEVRRPKGHAWGPESIWDDLNLAMPSPIPSARDAVVQTIFAASHGFTAASGSTGSLADDTVNYLLGKQSLKITTPGNGPNTFEAARKTGMPALDARDRYMALTIMVDHPERLAALRLDISSDSFTNWSTADIISPSTNADLPFLVADEWIEVLIPFGAYSVGGGSGATRNALTGFQVRVQDNGEGVVNCWVNKIAVVDEPSSAVISFTWDDGWDGQFTKAKPILDGYGYKASYGPIVGYVGESSFMTLDQLRLLARQGWDPCVHAYDTDNHVNYATISDEDAIDDARRAKDWTRKNLGPGDNFIIPEGALTSQARVEAFADFFNFSRTSYTRVRETWPPSRRSGLRSYTLSQAHNVADVKAKIDEAVVNREWLILEGHNVVDANPVQTDYVTADLQSVVDYIASLGVPVRTLAEMAQYGPPLRSVRADVWAAGQGLKGQNFDRSLAANASVFVSGTIFLVAVPHLRGDVISTIELAIQTAASSWTTTLAKAAIFTTAGKFLGVTANQTTAWDTVGVKGQDLTTRYIVPSDQDIMYGFLVVGSGTTAPAMARASSNTNPNGAISPGTRPVAALTGQTDITGDITISSGAGIALWTGWK